MNCPGPITSFITGEQLCRMDPTWQPQEDETWEETCAVCQQWQERFDEIRGDMKRDEGLSQFCDISPREASV